MKRGTFLKNLAALALVPKTVKALGEVNTTPKKKLTPENIWILPEKKLNKIRVAWDGHSLETEDFSIEQPMIDVTRRSNGWKESVPAKYFFLTAEFIGVTQLPYPSEIVKVEQSGLQQNYSIGRVIETQHTIGDIPTAKVVIECSHKPNNSLIYSKDGHR